MSTLPPCDTTIRTNGTLVFQTHSLSAAAAEKWVQKIAVQSGQPVDWHYMGGRIMVKALGDLGRVKAAIRALMAEHDAAYARGLPAVLRQHPPRPAWWDDATNETAEMNTAPCIRTEGDRLVLEDPVAAAMVQAVTRGPR